MATLKIKKGDTVKVIAGKDNGKEGKVVSVDPYIQAGTGFRSRILSSWWSSWRFPLNMWRT